MALTIGLTTAGEQAASVLEDILNEEFEEDTVPDFGEVAQVAVAVLGTLGVTGLVRPECFPVEED